jgi:hypothetical protein
MFQDVLKNRLLEAAWQPPLEMIDLQRQIGRDGWNIHLCISFLTVMKDHLHSSAGACKWRCVLKGMYGVMRQWVFAPYFGMVHENLRFGETTWRPCHTRDWPMSSWSRQRLSNLWRQRQPKRRATGYLFDFGMKLRRDRHRLRQNV